jgi:hypothetical protein
MAGPSDTLLNPQIPYNHCDPAWSTPDVAPDVFTADGLSDLRSFHASPLTSDCTGLRPELQSVSQGPSSVFHAPTPVCHPTPSACYASATVCHALSSISSTSASVCSTLTSVVRMSPSVCYTLPSVCHGARNIPAVTWRDRFPSQNSEAAHGKNIF